MYVRALAYKSSHTFILCVISLSKPYSFNRLLLFCMLHMMSKESTPMRSSPYPIATPIRISNGLGPQAVGLRA